MTSIAETSGGQCVIIQEGDRLQTKVCVCVCGERERERELFLPEI